VLESTGGKNSLSSEFEEESKEKDLHRVVEHPADSAIGCLSKGVPGGHQILHLKEKEKGLSSLEV
jgi:hypothetical protein